MACKQDFFLHQPNLKPDNLIHNSGFIDAPVSAKVISRKI